MIVQALWIAVFICGVWSDDNVIVIREVLSYDQTYTIEVNYTTEYILDFVPSAEDSNFPTRLWMSSDGGDTSHPLLVTARQRSGATIWQLPYYSGSQLLHEFHRTLCPHDSIEEQDGDCAPTEQQRQHSRTARGAVSLHVVSSCAQSLSVQVRVQAARDWFLHMHNAIDTVATRSSPAVYYYNFRPDQTSVRLIVSSEDDVCATLSVQNYTCPIAETLSEMGTATQASLWQLTMLRSGAVQLARTRFPRGFYVVVVVHPDNSECVEETAEEDTLWDQVMWGPQTHQNHISTTKAINISLQPSLSRNQYIIATLAATLFFLGFYVAFGVLVWMQRWEWFAPYVAPKAVLANPNSNEAGLTEADGMRTRRRRGSDATFDSSDNSDTDSEEATVTTAGSPGARTPHSPSATSPPGTRPASPPAVAPSPPGVTPSAVTLPPGTLPDGRGVRSSTASADPEVRADVLDNGNGFVNGANVEQQVPTNDPAVSPESRPYGLPPQLRLAVLARRQARVIRARSDRYLYLLYTVGVFYALPVIQFVVAFQIFMNLSGSLDVCYYNFLCAHPAGDLSDFNHVFSNLGYLLLGALFMLQLRRRRQARKRQPRDEEYGIPAHYGLLSSLGAGMMMVALLSASYHVCPNRLNFQFDTAFMYVLAVLSMVKIYQSRHPDVNARAHSTFGVLAVFIAIVVAGVLGGGPLFWGMFTVIHVFTFLLLSLRIYYVGQFRLGKESIATAAREIRALPKTGLRPLYTTRLIMLLIANAINWAFAIYGLFTQPKDFASHLLTVLLCNTLVHMIFYLTMKLVHGERPRWYSWCYLAAATAAWIPGLYFFTSSSSQWSTTPAQSRHFNHECRVLQFYDNHDLWHILSAIGLYFSFNAMMTWDDGLAAVKRTEIAVF